MGRMKKIIIGMAVCLALYTAVGFWVLPAVSRSILSEKLTEALHRKTSIERIRFNPFSLKLFVEGFSIKTRDGEKDFAAFKQLYLNLSSVSVFKMSPVLTEAVLEGPRVRIVRNKDGSFNFSDISEGSGKKKDGDRDAPAKPFLFSLSNIGVRGGSLEYYDGGLDVRHLVSGINLAVPLISNMGDQATSFVTPEFSALVNGSEVRLKGKSKLFDHSLESRLNLSLNGIKLSRYVKYLPPGTGVIPSSGTMGVSVEAAYKQEEDGRTSFKVSGSVNMNSLVIRDLLKRELASIGGLKITLNPSRILDGEIKLDEVSLEGLEIGVTRQDDGELNIFNLAGEKSEAASSKGKAGSKPFPLHLTLNSFSLDGSRLYLEDAGGDGGAGGIHDIYRLETLRVDDLGVDTAKRKLEIGNVGLSGGQVLVERLPDGQLNLQVFSRQGDGGSNTAAESKTAPSGEKAGKPWKIDLSQLRLDNFSVKGENLAGKSRGQLSLSDLTFSADRISTYGENSGSAELSFRLNDSSSFKAAGKLQIPQRKYSAKLALESLNLPWFQPFVEDYLALVVKSGILGVRGNMELSLPMGQSPVLRVTGEGELSKLSVIDREKAENLISWKRVGIKGAEFDLDPMALHIKDVGLDGIVSDIRIDEDGKANLQKIALSRGKVEKPQDKETGTPGDTSSPDIRIDKIMISGSELNFSDRSVTPGFLTRVAEIGGSVNGLSSRENMRADVAVSAKVNGHAPVEVTGKVDPLTRDLFLDMAFRLKNMDLAPLGTYSGKYVGYGIQKGRLSLDMNYHIEDRSLKASNDVVVNQFDFGKKVKSPDAVNLPVTLAVSLLKDRNGMIELKLPVKGRTDDPEFSVGGVVFKMLGNILVKAATSPFSLLGAIVGGGADLSTYSFEEGSHLLEEKEVQALETLAQALYDRPGANIEVEGFYHPERDRAALTAIILRERVAAVKIRDTIASTGKEPEGAVDLSEDEYARFLTDVYVEEGLGASPGDSEEAVDPSVMEQALMEHFRVSDGDLVFLAGKRSQEIVNALLATGKVTPERIFTVEKTSGASGEKGDSKAVISFR